MQTSLLRLKKDFTPQGEEASSMIRQPQESMSAAGPQLPAVDYVYLGFREYSSREDVTQDQNTVKGSEVEEG